MLIGGRCLEVNPVVVAMRPQERPPRWRMFCISSARVNGGGKVARLQSGPQTSQPGPIQRGPAANIHEYLLAVGKDATPSLQIVGVGVSGYPHAGVPEQFSAHLSLAHASGTAARYYDGQNSGYAKKCPFMTELAGRKARNWRRYRPQCVVSLRFRPYLVPVRQRERQN